MNLPPRAQPKLTSKCYLIKGGEAVGHKTFGCCLEFVVKPIFGYWADTGTDVRILPRTKVSRRITTGRAIPRNMKLGWMYASPDISHHPLPKAALRRLNICMKTCFGEKEAALGYDRV